MIKHPETTGINKRLLKVFVLQMLFISLVTVLGVYAAARVVEGVMMRAALEDEAAHFWELYASNQNQPLPNTDNLTGFLLDTNHVNLNDTVPTSIQKLEPGFGRVKIGQKEPLAFVEEKQDIRLILIFDEQSVKRLSFYFGVVPLSLILIVIYLSAWVAFRQSRKVVSPLVQLANTMKSFDPGEDSLESLNLEQLKSRYQDDEVNVLVDALAGFTQQISDFIERERRFTRDASHELRTPLSVIQGSAEWLKMTQQLDNKQNQAVDRILRTVRNMTEMVNMLLLLARGQHAPIEKSDINIRLVVDDVLSQIQSEKDDCPKVEVLIDSQDKVVVAASLQVLTVILSNLIRNAYNYTCEGEIYIRIQDGYFSITNFNQKMKQPDMSKLFQPFYRDVNDPLIKGYGVGLDIVKRLCDAVGWEIEAGFSPETGMTFTVSL